MDNTLSLSELNEIAAEFGVEFHFISSDLDCVVSTRPVPTALADRLEDCESRWCEVLRRDLARGLRRYFGPDDDEELTLTP